MLQSCTRCWHQFIANWTCTTALKFINMILQMHFQIFLHITFFVVAQEADDVSLLQVLLPMRHHFFPVADDHVTVIAGLIYVYVGSVDMDAVTLETVRRSVAQNAFDSASERVCGLHWFIRSLILGYMPE